MYKFIDTHIEAWALTDRKLTDGTRQLEIVAAIGEEDTIAVGLDVILARELIVRLQFFIEHGRLPKERPEYISSDSYAFYCTDCEKRFTDGEPKTIDGPACPWCGSVNTVQKWEDVVARSDTCCDAFVSRACDDVYLHPEENKRK